MNPSLESLIHWLDVVDKTKVGLDFPFMNRCLLHAFREIQTHLRELEERVTVLEESSYRV